jgi:Tol biopolymer transport system component
MENGKWTGPEVAPFSGHYSDIEPFYSPDGKRIYFSSNRPLEGTGEPRPDFDIWYVEKTGDGWADAVNIGAPVNTEGNEFYPSVTADGTLYLTASYESSLGFEDIYKSELVDGKYADPINLGETVNSRLYEYNSFIAPDESYIIYSGHGRQDGFGSGDLYVSFRQEDGSWSKAVNMGERINSGAIDYCPYVSPDGEYLFFSSNRKAGGAYTEIGITYDQMLILLAAPENGLGDIYWISASIIDEIKAGLDQRSSSP